MGIDVLDIVFRVEEAFAIKLSDDDLAALSEDNDVTVGALYEAILTKIHLREVGRYDIRLHYQLWSEIRRDLHAATRAPLEAIELKTPLEAIFPRETRREAWEALQAGCRYRIRGLEYPRIVTGAG